jgi:hypothetical protein
MCWAAAAMWADLLGPSRRSRGPSGDANAGSKSWSVVQAGGWWQRRSAFTGADRGWWWSDPGEEATDRWRGRWIEEGEAATELATVGREEAGGLALDPATAGWVAADLAPPS